MLFYFSATGNCLYVAKEMDKNPISIPQIIHNDHLTFEDETIGIVAPDYAGELPKIVVEFMKKAKFKTDYFYMLITYGKNDSVVGEWSTNFGKELGIDVKYVQTILMVDNYLPVFDMKEEMAMDKKIPEQLALAKENIEKRATGCPVPTEHGREAYANVKKRDPRFNNGSQITVTEKCIGCGICSKVCPVGNFYMEDGVAKRKCDICEFCLACAHHCPSKAIALSIMDKNRDARYINPEIKLQEIISANNQTK